MNATYLILFVLLLVIVGIGIGYGIARLIDKSKEAELEKTHLRLLRPNTDEDSDAPPPEPKFILRVFINEEGNEHDYYVRFIDGHATACDVDSATLLNEKDALEKIEGMRGGRPHMRIILEGQRAWVWRGAWRDAR